MSEDILNNVQKMLNEEKFTRSALSNYSTAQFNDLDKILSKAKDEHCLDELKAMCDEHLSHSKNSIIAEYFSGIISLSHQIIDDAGMVSLVQIFVDNHKGNIVKYLCERILDHGESKSALRTLGDFYKNENKEAELYDIWRRLVKIDYEEADIAKSLADHAEKEGNLDEAVDFYKKALHRYINKQLFTNVREIWQKLLDYMGDDVDFFVNLQGRVAKNISPDKAELLLWDLYHLCKKKENTDRAISVLKLILDYDEKDRNARKEITDCFRKKYAAHSQLEEYIKVSNLSQEYRNVQEAILDFEKHIAFDKGNFVFHKTWGVGRIASVDEEEVVIDFAKKRTHPMSVKMAVSALQTLAKDHIWVLKATWKKDKLHAKIKEDVSWALKTTIRSFDNYCTLKKIKSELVPAALTVGEWSAWNTKAKEILSKDPGFGVDPENIDAFTVRERPISIEEKLYNEFKAERKFFNRVDTFRKFIRATDVETGAEYLNEMIDYFTGFLKESNQDKVSLITSYLIIKDLSGRFPELSVNLQINFNTIFESVEKVNALYSELKYKDDEKDGDVRYNLQSDFLNQIKLFVSGWQDYYVRLFPKALDLTILHSLKEDGNSDKIVSMIRNCFENYKENRSAVVWFYNNYRDDPLYIKAAIPLEKELITLIHIFDITFREMESHRNTAENKKINKAVYAILFGSPLVTDYIANAERENVVRIFTLLQDVKDLDPAEKLKLQNLIRDRFSDFKFTATTEKGAVSRTLLVTAAKYEEKQKQLSHIMEVEVPANSKEIAFALSLGDLRENAEYKAAKEKQDILNTTVSKLKGEIERAQLFDPATIDTSHISFGTKVTLFNATKQNSEVYTILGPWESDPDNYIISYLSPLGVAIINKRIGEKIDFGSDDGHSEFEIKEITAANI